MTSYSHTNMGQHWFVTRRYQAITSTNVDFTLVNIYGIHICASAQPTGLYIEWENYTFPITATSARGQWVKQYNTWA